MLDNNQINNFLEQYKLFQEMNPDFDLKKFNFNDELAIEKLIFDHSLPEITKESLRIFRRLSALPCSVESAVALYKRGITSANQLASIPKHKFLKQYSDCFEALDQSVTEKAAELTHKHAVSIASHAFINYIAITQHNDPYYKATIADNLSTATDNALRDMPTYNELFNNGNYCTCPDCRSMLSPAAYFVDLMRLQDDYITESDVKYQLKTRRPDLWNIELSCSNTNDLISKLKIVNKVLLANSGLAGTTESAKYQALTTQKYPLNLPINMPLLETGINLDQSDTSLAEIWQNFPDERNNKADEVTNRQQNIAINQLGISPEQWNIVAHSNDNVATIASYYGVNNLNIFKSSGEGTEEEKQRQGQEKFLKSLALNYEQFESLLFEDLGEQEIEQKLYQDFFINVGSNINFTNQTIADYKTAPKWYADNNFDRVNRFVRLAFAMGWSFTELDWALRSIGDNTKISIDDKILPYLAWIKEQKNKLKLSVNQLCGYLYQVKDFGNQKGKTFFQQIFDGANVPEHEVWGNQSTGYTVTWIVPPHSLDDKQELVKNQKVQNALASALKLNNNDLVKIGNALLKAKLADTDPSKFEIKLTLKNLSILYRLSLLQTLTGYTIDQCVVAYALPLMQSVSSSQLVQADSYGFAVTEANHKLITANIDGEGKITISDNEQSKISQEVAKPNTMPTLVSNEAGKNYMIWCGVHGHINIGLVKDDLTITRLVYEQQPNTRTRSTIGVAICDNHLFFAYLNVYADQQKESVIEVGVLNLNKISEGFKTTIVGSATSIYSHPNLLAENNIVRMVWADGIDQTVSIAIVGRVDGNGESLLQFSDHQSLNYKTNIAPIFGNSGNDIYYLDEDSKTIHYLDNSLLNPAPDKAFVSDVAVDHLIKIIDQKIFYLANKEVIYILYSPNEKIMYQPDLLVELAGAKDVAEIYKITTQLTSITNWLKEQKLSPYMVEYWITGKTDDKNIKNKILSDTEVDNAIIDVYNRLLPTLLTEEAFNLRIEQMVTHLLTKYIDVTNNDKPVSNALKLGMIDSGKELLNEIWKKIYINCLEEGIVTNLNAVPYIQGIINDVIIDQKIVQKEIVQKEIIALVEATLLYYYELQHHTFNHALASIYNIDAGSMGIIASWVLISLQSIIRAGRSLVNADNIITVSATPHSKVTDNKEEEYKTISIIKKIDATNQIIIDSSYTTAIFYIPTIVNDEVGVSYVIWVDTEYKINIGLVNNDLSLTPIIKLENIVRAGAESNIASIGAVIYNGNLILSWVDKDNKTFIGTIDLANTSKGFDIQDTKIITHYSTNLFAENNGDIWMVYANDQDKITTAKIITIDTNNKPIFLSEIDKQVYDYQTTSTPIFGNTRDNIFFLQSDKNNSTLFLSLEVATQYVLLLKNMNANRLLNALNNKIFYLSDYTGKYINLSTLKVTHDQWSGNVELIYEEIFPQFSSVVIGSKIITAAINIKEVGPRFKIMLYFDNTKQEISNTETSETGLLTLVTNQKQIYLIYAVDLDDSLGFQIASVNISGSGSIIKQTFTIKPYTIINKRKYSLTLYAGLSNNIKAVFKNPNQILILFTALSLPEQLLGMQQYIILIDLNDHNDSKEYQAKKIKTLEFISDIIYQQDTLYAVWVQNNKIAYLQSGFITESEEEYNVRIIKTYNGTYYQQSRQGKAIFGSSNDIIFYIDLSSGKLRISYYIKNSKFALNINNFTPNSLRNTSNNKVFYSLGMTAIGGWATYNSYDHEIVIEAEEWLENTSGFSVANPSEVARRNIIKQLQYMQTYASWASILAFQYPETQLIKLEPKRFGFDFKLIHNIHDLRIWLTFENVKTLYQFRALLDASYNVSTESLFEYAVNIFKSKATISDIYVDYLKYLVTKKLNISASLLEEIIELSYKQYTDTSDNYSTLENIADELWVGLQAQRANSTELLKKIENSLYNKQRNYLLPLVIYYLVTNKEIKINNTRDLYNYLLIDVEVDAVVETSYIVEGNSAVQLYINRCLNNMEPTAKLEFEVSAWWPWMDSYRTWQANRQVFFFPENYIKPELRKHKTTLFKNLENNLQQIDLNDEIQVEAVLTQYVTELANIANLTVVSAAAYDYTPSKKDGKTVKEKKIFMVGSNGTQPVSYYYMIATFIDPDGTGNYLPALWDEWLPIDVAMNPKKSITVTCNFDPITNEWYINWVEQTESGVITGSSGVQQPAYINTTYNSYLNDSKEWSAPQNTLKHAKTTTNISLHTSIHSSQTIVMPYEYENQTIIPAIMSNIVPLMTRKFVNDYGTDNIIANNHIDGIEFAPIVSNTLKNFSYYTNYNKAKFENIQTDASASVSFWFYLDVEDIEDITLCTIELPSISKITIKDGQINLNAYNTEFNILPKNWYHISFIIVNSEIPTLVLNDKEYQIASDEINATDNAEINIVIKFDDFANKGSMQELLYFDYILTINEMTALYQNSVKQITVDFLKNTQDTLVTEVAIYVANQPNWFFLNRDKASYLEYPWKENATAKTNIIRINSNAIDQITKTLSLDGIKGLLSIPTQLLKEVSLPIPTNIGPIQPSAGLDFFAGPIRKYWWELFFQAPFLIANQLHNQQKFASAKEWYQYIFNPTIIGDNYIDLEDTSKRQPNDKYWGFIPLRSYYNETLKGELGKTQAEGIIDDTAKGSPQLFAYHYEPFNPQAIAALRPIAYQKTILMHYVDNLITWGDKLYAQNNYESISEAAMVYITAYNLLGNTPENLGACSMPKDETIKGLNESSTKFIDNSYGFAVLTKNDTELMTANISASGQITIHYQNKAKTNTNTDIMVLSNASPTLLFDGNYIVWCNKPLSDTNYGYLSYGTIDSDLKITQISSLTRTIYRTTEAVIIGDYLFCAVIAGANMINLVYCKLGSTSFTTTESGFQTLSYPSLKILGNDIWMVWGDLDGKINRAKIGGIENNTPYVEPTIKPEHFSYTTKINPIFGETINDIFYVDKDDKTIKYFNTKIKLTVAISADVIQQLRNVIDNKIYYLANNIGYVVSSSSINSEFIILLEESQIPAGNRAILHGKSPVNYIPNAYFGMPYNEQLLNYWEVINQRLYNIRHSLTMNGQKMQVPLFAPAIDPMALVQQIGSGSTLDQMTFENAVNIPYYRFNATIARAKEVTQLVAGFGQSLLSALTQKDAEALALLYNNNQQQILALTQTVNDNQLLAAQDSVKALELSKQNAKIRLDYYNKMIENGYSSYEDSEIELNSAAFAFQASAQILFDVAGPLFAIPNVFGFAVGGSEPGKIPEMSGTAMHTAANTLMTKANIAGIKANFERREEEWGLQKDLSQNDVDQIERQIIAGKYQVTIAEQQIKILNSNLKQEKEVWNFLKDKFTNEQLYQWMAGKLSALYFQGYQLAYAIAQQAEKAMGFELGIEFPKMLQSTYWNSTYNGLLACDSLALDLQRIEQNYMDQNKRRFEVQKTISLLQLNPEALIKLVNNGLCEFSLKEEDFDIDYPSHYCRQIKSISLSFPALLAPYTNIHATLTQTSNSVLTKPEKEGVEYLLRLSTNMPASVRKDMVANQQVVLSQGINDTGLFTVNFDDARYLPFEGTGAISSWILEMPHDNNSSIDFNNLTDVIIQVNYTSLQGGSSFAGDVNEKLAEINYNGYLAYSMAASFSDAWYGFINEHKPLGFAIDYKPLPQNKNKTATIISVYIQLILTELGIEKFESCNIKVDFGDPQSTTKLDIEKDTNSVAYSKTAVTWDLPVGANACMISIDGIKINDSKILVNQCVSNMIVNFTYKGQKEKKVLSLQNNKIVN